MELDRNSGGRDARCDGWEMRVRWMKGSGEEKDGEEVGGGRMALAFAFALLVMMASGCCWG